MNDTDDSGLRFEEEERLPWLEPIDDYEEDGASPGRLIGLVLAGLGAIGLVVGGLWWWQNNGARGNAEVIAAPEGDYKVPPKSEPGRFDGEGTVAVAAAEGQTPTGNLDASKAPERPVVPAPAAPAARPAAPAAGAGAPVAKAGDASAAEAAGSAGAARINASTAAGTGGTVQLGAFASEGTAAKAWDSLKGRFDWLANVNRSIIPATVNGRTVYRLRAAAGSNSAAQSLCQRLRVAGENCIVL